MAFVHTVTVPNMQLQAREEKCAHWQAKSKTQEEEEKKNWHEPDKSMPAR